MSTGIALFLGLALICFVLSLFDLLMGRMLECRTTEATGRVADSWTAGPENMTVRGNSRHAYIGFYVDGRYIISENAVQVPLSAINGTEVLIRYYPDAPSKIVRIQPKRPYVLLAVAFLFFLIAFLNYAG